MSDLGNKQVIADNIKRYSRRVRASISIRTKDRAECFIRKTGLKRSNTYKKGAISSHLFFFFVEFLITSVLKSI